jgi:hypothetical protein
MTSARTLRSSSLNGSSPTHLTSPVAPPGDLIERHDATHSLVTVCLDDRLIRRSCRIADRLGITLGELISRVLAKLPFLRAVNPTSNRKKPSQ